MSASSIVTRGGAQKAKIQTRAVVKGDQRKSSTALLEAKKKAKLKMSSNQPSDSIKDIYQNAMDSVKLVRGETGIIYEECMVEHQCLWDKDHYECPERLSRILERCKELTLLEKCRRIPSRSAEKHEILLKHSESHYDILKSSANMTDENELELLSSKYDYVYFHPSTFRLSLLATGCTIELVDHILDKKIQNGMAIIRPPGHHAMKSEFNGYCYLNNVAIAAAHALQKRNLNKILIVDWDIHHGQGTQRNFYNDPRVLYFSIHRFEFGTYWPNLKESDFNYIGEGRGLGYNFNVPLNKIGVQNGDYMAIFQQLLLPVAIEFQPQLIIISAGFDCAHGCPEGEMELTPSIFPHLLSPLLSLAEGKIAVVLEGGYCIDSLAESAAMSLRTLLGAPCPNIPKIEVPCESVQESILNCIYAHRPYWKCLQVQKTYSLVDLNNLNPQPNLHKVVQIFKGTVVEVDKHETRDLHPIRSKEILDAIDERLRFLRLSTSLDYPINRLCVVYDELMMEHHNKFDLSHPESPQRIKKIRDRLFEYGIFDRVIEVKSRYATKEELCLVHSNSYVNLIQKLVGESGLREIGDRYDSIYFHPKTYESATLAAGSVLQVVDAVLQQKVRAGLCVIRPPGHHAESDLPHGFCIFNNISIAARYAVKEHGLKRVLILDWDVHHGNGTQHIFESDPSVLYISLHRYDNGSFFPKSKDANFDVVGNGKGKGFTVNIPWNKKGMGDIEYMLAFHNVIMPIAYEFNPELVLISAGFDAAIGDPLGGCKVTPEAYGYFTHWISSLANGRVIVCLEGGYNTNSISYAATMCAKSLLGDPLPQLNLNPKSDSNSSCIETLRNVMNVQEKYWNCIKFNKKLPSFAVEEQIEELSDLNSVSSAVVDKKPIVTACNDNMDHVSELNSSISFMEYDDGKCIKNDNAMASAATSSGYSAVAGTSRETTKTLTDFLIENMGALMNEDMFAVIPLKDCPHLPQLCNSNIQTSIDTKTPCAECGSANENWLCLHCFKTLCGRYIAGHMLQHFSDCKHTLTLSYHDLSVWCYACEAYIDNPQLYKYINLAHLDKFGEGMAMSERDKSIYLELDKDQK